jgi:hypothetical protein
LRQSRSLRACERLERAPPQVERWENARLHDGLTPGARVITLQRERWRTVTGWPLSLVWSRILGGPTRLHGFYRFFDHVAWASVTFADAAEVAARGAEVIAHFAAARPIFDGAGLTHLGEWTGG